MVAARSFRRQGQARLHLVGTAGLAEEMNLVAHQQKCRTIAITPELEQDVVAAQVRGLKPQLKTRILAGPQGGTSRTRGTGSRKGIALADARHLHAVDPDRALRPVEAPVEIGGLEAVFPGPVIVSIRENAGNKMLGQSGGGILRKRLQGHESDQQQDRTLHRFR